MFFKSFLRFGKVISAINKDIIIGVSYILYIEHRERGKMLKVALDGGTRPGDTLQIHPHFLSLMGDGQANAFRWRDTSPRAALSVVLCITYNFDLIIQNYYYKFYNCYHKLHNCIIYNI